MCTSEKQHEDSAIPVEEFIDAVPIGPSREEPSREEPSREEQDEDPVILVFENSRGIRVFVAQYCEYWNLKFSVQYEIQEKVDKGVFCTCDFCSEDAIKCMCERIGYKIYEMFAISLLLRGKASGIAECLEKYKALNKEQKLTLFERSTLCVYHSNLINIHILDVEL